MKTSYDIYSSNGFIGFVIVFNSGQYIQGSLMLFETIQHNGNLALYQQAGLNKIYQIGMTDIDIIRNLMVTAIPSLRTNSLSYNAIDIYGKSQVI